MALPGQYIVDRFGRPLLDEAGHFLVHDPNADPCCGTIEDEGACCYPDGTCVNHVNCVDCRASGGICYPDQACSEIDCPTIRACCLPYGGCADLTREECADLGGEWNYQHSCEDEDFECEEWACCSPDSEGHLRCSTTTRTLCRELGGRFYPGLKCPMQCEPEDCENCGPESQAPAGYLLSFNLSLTYCCGSYYRRYLIISNPVAVKQDHGASCLYSNDNAGMSVFLHVWGPGCTGRVLQKTEWPASAGLSIGAQSIHVSLGARGDGMDFALQGSALHHGNCRTGFSISDVNGYLSCNRIYAEDRLGGGSCTVTPL